MRPVRTLQNAGTRRTASRCGLCRNVVFLFFPLLIPVGGDSLRHTVARKISKKTIKKQMRFSGTACFARNRVCRRTAAQRPGCNIPRAATATRPLPGAVVVSLRLCAFSSCRCAAILSARGARPCHRRRWRMWLCACRFRRVLYVFRPVQKLWPGCVRCRVRGLKRCI